MLLDNHCTVAGSSSASSCQGADAGTIKVIDKYILRAVRPDATQSVAPPKPML